MQFTPILTFPLEGEGTSETPSKVTGVWIPAFAGMTVICTKRLRGEGTSPENRKIPALNRFRWLYGSWNSNDYLGYPSLPATGNTASARRSMTRMQSGSSLTRKS